MKYSPELKLEIEKAVAGLQVLTASHEGLWQISQASWSVDQDVGDIVFQSPNGFQVTAPVQIIGTYNTVDRTWLWSWANPSIEVALTKHAKVVEEYGKKHDFTVLTERKLKCTKKQCWELTALANMLNGSQGAYPGPDGTAYVLMTFGTVKVGNILGAFEPPGTVGEGAEGHLAKGHNSLPVEGNDPTGANLDHPAVHYLRSFFDAYSAWELEIASASKTLTSAEYDVEWSSYRERLERIYEEYCAAGRNAKRLRDKGLSYSVLDTEYDSQRDVVTSVVLKKKKVIIETKTEITSNTGSRFESNIFEVVQVDGGWKVRDYRTYKYADAKRRTVIL
jgi:Family of unknown function (DUF6882)/NTF2 fold immunity protein